MDKKEFPILDILLPSASDNKVESKTVDTFDSEGFYSVASPPPVESAADAEAVIVGTPISSVMDENLWTADAEDTIEKVENLLSEKGLSSVPVMGSNGEIIGMIGAQELALFHSEKKNAKAVRAWEISRIKAFEASPGDTVGDVAKLMIENKIENIAITEFGALQGVVSVQDVVQVILTENASLAAAADSSPAN